MREFKIFTVMADLHIGRKTVSVDSLKQQLIDHYFAPMERMKYLDLICIAGDIMHTAVSLNSEYSILFYWFIDKVYKLARKKNASVIIVRGTLSHDCGQLDNIKNYVNNDDGVDFRIYETVEEVTLWDDYKVLVLPDLRVKQLKEIDDYLKPGRYDMIFGHGTIDQMQFTAQESENTPTKVYVYDVAKLMKASKGPVIFGHIHQYQHISPRFWYAGSFTTLERGCDGAGFLIGGIYDKDRTKFKVERYFNPDAAEYYELVVTSKILNEIPIDEIVEAIDEIRSEAKDNDLFTLRIVRGDATEAADKVMILEGKYRADKRFTISKKVKSKQEEEHEKEQEKRKEKFAYLLDESLELPSILYTYYLTEVKPTFPDQQSIAASLVEEDFRRALMPKGE